MKGIKLSPKRRMDWMNYIDLRDQQRAKNQVSYLINKYLDAIIEGNGQVVLVIHLGEDYQAHTVLSRSAKRKLQFLLKLNLKKGDH
ncbi:MAG: hypothetical protein KCHDKBKB_01029 [Elusimicrobia bacterium]|nr:hypothetical protein [Elusimicrobiota bacterium]